MAQDDHAYYDSSIPTGSSPEDGENCLLQQHPPTPVMNGSSGEEPTNSESQSNGHFVARQNSFTTAPNLMNSSKLFTQILEMRAIQYADHIFGLSDYEIIMELVTVGRSHIDFNFTLTVRTRHWSS